ncbi:MAG: hydrogenase expression/formation protein HypE [Clostridiales Family XIII bacterium]|nr:hydrogenase expression/formation protein HypE [Clostridiales Family XIII bacterium]
MREDKVKLAHGAGGYESAELIDKVFRPYLTSAVLGKFEDAGVVRLWAGGERPDAPAEQIAVSTDSFVVRPIIFRGGDIGKLAVCGSVNDVVMTGAEPKFLTCGFVLDTGLSINLLEKIVRSLAMTADEAGVEIIACDTKVVAAGEHEAYGHDGQGSEGHDAPDYDAHGAGDKRLSGGSAAERFLETGEPGLIINTTCIGAYPTDSVAAMSAGAAPADGGSEAARPSSYGIKAGDAILVSGDLGRHHAAILSARMGVENNIESDCALLLPLVKALKSADIQIHSMRDITRGGLGTVLNELAASSGVRIEIEKSAIPVNPEVRAFAGIMGLDPLYMGNEGRMVLAVAEEDAKKALAALRSFETGENAAVAGIALSARSDGQDGTGEPLVVMRTPIGGLARVSPLYGEGLPRIC